MDYKKRFLNCRNSVYDQKSQKFLLSKLMDSEQEKDLAKGTNCSGYGRIRHFKRHIAEGWLPDSLPIDPACESLKSPYVDFLEAQVFQIASCNVNCWFCFVPDDLKLANANCSKWFSASEMIDLYENDKNKAPVIDLSGGNPELVPEWIYEMMKELENKKLNNKVYLWSDDTLTTDFLFDNLSDHQLDYMKNYQNYGKVCCLKGFDENSFSFNTGLPSYMFDDQLRRFREYIDFGFDTYGYINLTTNTLDGLARKINLIFDRLQNIHELLPLRIIPLKIAIYSPTVSRINDIRIKALEYQNIVVECWKEELYKRFNTEQTNRNIAKIKLN